MADDQEQGSEWLLRGAFGSLQQSAAQHLDTAQTWQNLRITVGTWSYQAQGGGETPSDDELEEAGRQILSAQGVGIRQVNQYRAIANQWRTARTNAQNADPEEQVNASSIFRPPWGDTTQESVPDRYRVRVNWEITPDVGDAFTKWSSYELTSPLTSIDDILAEAGAKAAGDRYLYLLSGGQAPEVSDFEIEQI